MFYGTWLANHGQLKDTVREARRGVELDPLHAWANYFLAMSLEWSREFDAAIDQARATMELDPGYYQAHWALGWAMAGKGEYPEAVEAFEHAVARAPGDGVSEVFLAWAHGLAHQSDKAKTILDRLERKRTTGDFSPAYLAYAYVAIGDKERALDRLETACDEHDPGLFLLSFWWPLDPLRSDSRFQALLQRMNFPATTSPDHSDITIPGSQR
jgi:tetratricopeptide (TPR) repeat protein